MNYFQLTKNTFYTKSDLLGSLASALCLIHCLATPFLFIAHASTVGHTKANPFWWSMIDIFLLIFSFIAVYWTTRKTSKQWMKYALFTSWLILSFIIFNEKLSLFDWAGEAIYLPTISLVVLHLYNRKYCQCTDEQHCIDQ